MHTYYQRIIELKKLDCTIERMIALTNAHTYYQRIIGLNNETEQSNELLHIRTCIRTTSVSLG